ncbi:outer membrane protein assembly factor BamB family protein [Catellatospora citrea]|uniref:Pyrrolo-quinoline quinone repeat domain-containing protein n=1 Tax=Catellatospora citrea TaxID=53366 RepID=A0A8J3K4F5_9ACTN|nr:PQQ-binding-like beta-propeller repeat protein [Catellatospora citrea]RKE11089.1 putative pyrroloquinoline-quinone binding quinoprotein [Catellatospora citrea]GIF96546.1 hypothetical protein Cci01nite_16400 [Catellatospora citrea]
MNGEPTFGTTAVIDLGAGWQDHQTGPARPGLRAAVLRPLAAVAAVILMLALGGGAPARRLDELAAISLSPQGDFQIIGDMLLVRDVDRLAGYSLDDGMQRWKIKLPGTAGSGLAPAGNVPGVMVTEMQEAATNRRTTYAVDVGTGSILWQDGLPMMTLADVAVAIWSTDTDKTSMQITVRDVRTGRQRWSVQNVLPAIDYPALIRSEAELPIWTLQSTGELTARDLRDGRVLRRHRIDLGRAVPADLSVSGDELILETALDGKNTTARYSTADLAPIPLTAPYVGRTDCGAYWCTQSQSAEQTNPSPVDIVDKATGVVRRRFVGGSFVVPTPLGLLVAGPELDGSGPPAVALLDAATARPLFDVTGWRVYLTFAASGAVLVRGTGRGPGQVAWLTPGGLDLAQLPVPVERCVFAARAVACPRPTGTLTVWRLARGHGDAA